MIGTGLAILGAGLLGAGASMYGASKASSAQEAAANKAAAVQQQAMEYQKQNYDTASGNLSPFIKTGTGANNLLASFYGINGSDPALGQNALAAFNKSPDYQFALKGGSEALDNSAAAKGGALGGNQIRAQTEYGAGLATQNLQNYLTRLTGLSGQGIQAGGVLGQIGTGVGSQVGTSANNVANSTMAAGTAEASGILGMTKGFESGLNSLSLYNQLGKSSYGGAGTPNYLASYNGNQIGGLY
ncbi:hypothetical protein [Bradyrhizobium tunisiense]|uniref:hypothetical protein n=1 Tax=Bradyrhizobium tunisiense TaxID=3278709 RepID=UPI0035D768D0